MEKSGFKQNNSATAKEKQTKRKREVKWESDWTMHQLFFLLLAFGLSPIVRVKHILEKSMKAKILL